MSAQAKTGETREKIPTKVVKPSQPSDSSESSSESESDDNYDSDLVSDDDDSGDHDAKILSQYRHLLSRRVDLVGDYAGDELFLIEGDSLLLRCFADDKLDFDNGFQLLHATYNVEHFLQNLVQRKCHFNITFFNSNRELCLPPSASAQNANKFFLARAAIIRHLQQNLAKSHPSIHVDVFEAWDSSEFSKHLQTTSPYFIMAHDGALANNHNSNLIQEDRHANGDSKAPAPSPNRVPFREMILSFIDRGFNVSLLNGLEWLDAKVMTMVLEARNRAPGVTSETTFTSRAGSVPAQDVSAQLQKLDPSSLTERQILAVVTVVKLLSASASDVQQKARLCAAFLLHQALLTTLPLTARRVEASAGVQGAQALMNAVSSTAESILNSPSWASSLSGSTAGCDIMDFVDGRLLLQTIESHPKVSNETKAVFDELVKAVEVLATTDGISFEDASGGTVSSASDSSTTNEKGPQDDLAVLPFSNKVFDKHLQSIHIEVDEAAGGERSLTSRKIFQEVTHWHNAKKPLIVKAPLTPKEIREASKAAKRNQLFMAEMRTYAASLTNAVGKSLEPESIIVGIPRQSTQAKANVPSSPADSDASDSGASTQSKGKPGAKKGGGGKTAAKNAGKQAMLNQIAANKAKKDESAGDKIAGAWQVACKGFEADVDPRTRYRKAKDYLTNLKPEYKEVVGPECELYLLSCLLQYWIAACRQKEQANRIQVAALIWSHTRSIAQRGPLTKTIIKSLDQTVKALNLPPMPPTTEAAADRKLAFTFALPTKVESLSIGLSSKDFQLLQCGPYLERSFDSQPDPRVDFQPDGWQRKVLDTIDADQSVFVVAPTSSGKTFISFYAMRKVLEADDDGVLVYVAPTKALVNQIAAEIQARYSKKFKYGGKSVWAIHTRDYRINSPNGCQVLVTVPHVLQIMLLAPSNANSWSSRVRRIIFDEIHSIGNAEDGVVWEQLLLMAPCPIIALSATVGNPGEFSGWLATTQEAIGKKLITVQHPYRYSDLRKYFYLEPKRFDFQGVPGKSAFGSLGLEGLKGFNYVHPVAGLVDKSRGIPEDLALEARDCLYLYNAMKKVQTEDFPVSAALGPDKMLPDVSRKVDILKWEKELKVLLQQWLDDIKSPFDSLLAELEGSFRNDDHEELYTTAVGNTNKPGKEVTGDLLKSTLPMLCRLQEQDALPAICFNYDRHMCEKICKAVVDQLQEAETKQKKSGTKWEKTLEKFEEWKELKAKATSRASKAAQKKPSKKSKGDDDDGEDDKASKLDLQRESAGGEDTKWESFDPEAPVEGYHFADYAKVQKSELEIYIRQLWRRQVPQFLIDALGRGIGVHHAGMNRKYRQVVEILFRMGFLRVIFATGTLALGINMPCKTVVFSGDSVFLTALNYRQCAGRAGRRGFDLLGNVVFQGVSRQKVCRLISSRLPDLNGHFPLTTTLVLRLFTLLNDSNSSKYSVSAINALLSQPRLYMGGPSFKDQTMHHLRFSIEYLRRQHLLGADGAPLNFAGLVSHLYYTENSSFAFHALLKEGFFHETCARINTNEKDTLETLMLVMSHLFNRALCRQADAEYRETVVKPSSSLVFLPPMPKAASKILRDHNKQTLDVYKAYVETFVNQHITGDDRKLPLSGIQAGADGSNVAGDVNSLPATRIRSSFVGLSGHGDDFSNIHDLCSSVRDGVFLEEAVVPSLPTSEEMDVPLNAYLLDFFKHGDVFTIERANGIRRADIWFLLNDFSMVLATIITSLLNFMKLADGTDMDMLEVMGGMDAHEEAEDDKVAAVEAETQSDISGPSAADSGVVLAERNAKTPAAPTKKQAKNADSWEDLAGEEEDAAAAETRKKLDEEAEIQAQEMAAWDGDGNEGLKTVLKAFQKLQAEFNFKFRAMWA